MLYGFLFSVISLLLLLTSIWSYLRRRRQRLGVGEYDVIADGRDAALYGAITAVFGFILFSKQHHWTLCTVGLIAGIAAGTLVGRRQAKTWDSQLTRVGRLVDRIQSRAESPLGILVSVGGGVALGLFLFTGIPALTLRVGCVVMEGVPGFFLGLGAHNWLWGKQKERQGFRELVVSTRKT